MITLALDVGGTKFTVAVFDGERMVARESRATDPEGGGAWIMERIGEIVDDWRRSFRFDRCGIGFGGPVRFSEQTVALSTHVAGWNDVPLVDWVTRRAG